MTFAEPAKSPQDGPNEQIELLVQIRMIGHQVLESDARIEAAQVLDRWTMILRDQQDKNDQRSSPR